MTRQLCDLNVLLTLPNVDFIMDNSSFSSFSELRFLLLTCQISLRIYGKFLGTM